MTALVRDVARVKVELASPIAIGTGRGDALLDSLFVTDASGLPVLPGTSIAGVLRAAWRRTGGETSLSEDEVFGYQDREDGAPSRVRVSFGLIHDSSDRPVAPRLTAEQVAADQVLRFAGVPVVRQHVRIDHRGVADAAQHGLYDRSMVAAGNRFTFELEAAAEDTAKIAGIIDALVRLLAAGDVRLGAKTRSGLGALSLLAVRRRRFDLCNEADFADYCALPCAVHVPAPEALLPPLHLPDVDDGQIGDLVATLVVRPRGFWMFGGGAPTDEDAALSGGGKVPDMVPYREARVRWHGDRGRVEPDAPDYVVPASAVKGALRHRTAYHHNRLAKVFSDELADASTVSAFGGVDNQQVKLLFGHMTDHRDRGGGRAGHVVIDDVVLEQAPDRARVTHVSLDRFTSGPVDGALFDEAPCWRGPRWRIKVRVLDREQVEERQTRRALDLALRDLASGRLALGAGDGRGHGRLEGKMAWSDGGAWVSMKEA